MNMISDKQLQEVLHEHAHTLLIATPGLTPRAAMQKVAALAVLVYDEVTLEDLLRNAARECGVDAALADIIAAGRNDIGSSGATAALSTDLRIG